jgi:hypothetical protein
MKKYIFLSLAGLIPQILSQYGMFNTAYNAVNQHLYRNNCAHELAGHGNPKNTQVATENYYNCLEKWAFINKINLSDAKKNDYLLRDRNLMLTYNVNTFNLYNSSHPINRKNLAEISVRIFN